MMATFNIRAFDASRNQLDDDMDVHVLELPSQNVVKTLRRQSGGKTIKVSGLKPGRVYGVQVFPAHYRPVGAVQRAPDGSAPANVHVFCPIHPLRAMTTVFPAYADLDADLVRVLEASTLEREASDSAAPSATAPGATPGERLYNGLAKTAKAGLLNLFAKMQNTTSGGRTMWSFVTDLYRVRGDRIFANVHVDFRDHVRSAAAAREFEKVSGSLHTPPPDFTPADSFKHQAFDSGILQLTFFASTAAPIRFRIDADIDDAGGLGHVFQVLRNFLTQGDTHPYDIHQILTFHQLIDPRYELGP
jgi:hypothetical protein